MAISTKRTPLLNKLRRAVHKVKFILSFDPTKLILRGDTSRPAARLGLKIVRQPSLLDCTGDDEFCDERRASSSPATSILRTTSSTAAEMFRTMSGGASTADDADVDLKAEMFIAKFRNQLQIERQISLDLRYCRGLERTTSTTSDCM